MKQVQYIAVVVFIFTFKISLCQNVLDAPFIMERYIVYWPEPDAFFAYQLEGKSRNDYMRANYPYLQSFLYNEDEYWRIRVWRTIDLRKERNKPLSRALSDETWEKKESKWHIFSEEDSVKMIVNDEDIKYEFLVGFPFRISHLLGRNIEEMKKNKYNYEGSLYNNNKSEIQNLVEEGFLKIGNGILELTEKKYVPNKIVFEKFVDRTLDAIVLDNTVTAYEDDSFMQEMTTNEVVSKLSNDTIWISRDSIIKIRIKEDWFYNKKQNEFQSKIIGIGLVAIVNSKEVELFWIYYPELQYSIADYCTFMGDKIINYDAYLNNHYYEHNIDSTAYLGLYSNYIRNHDSYFLTEFDALIDVQLLSEEVNSGNYANYSKGNSKIKGKLLSGQKNGLWNWFYENGNIKCEIIFENNAPNGQYKSYYENGEKKEVGFFRNGLRTGNFKYWYENGKLKAGRNYKDGYLDGVQKIWWDNGNQYAQYSFEDKIINGILKRWNRNGSLMEKGEMKNGLVYGKWNYNIIINDKYCEMLKKNDLYAFDKQTASTAYDDCILQFSVEYIHSYEKDCPPLPDPICITHKLLGKRE
ncbi:MAG: hypothetical protein COA57_11540 [Flavobacteriales bacterium]|nr:MAG: hypothetical protein COA57_11540 [Flavobacteriales bacterium]